MMIVRAIAALNLALAVIVNAEFDLDYDNAKLAIVQTSYGPVQGFRVPFVDPSRSGHFEVFTGIPYAAPPVGPLRWQPPQDVVPWGADVYNATYFRPCCVQNLNNIREWSLGPNYNNANEDCLYLNIFTSRNGSADPLRPVMVFVHGGAYRYGSGEEYDGRVLGQQGVVLVTINYRLGPFGFLSTDDDVAPGNYGMLDIVAALRWVKVNIDNFGGDPNSVTVFGQSAGGGAVSLLMFSPLTKGLIHRVIPQSGDALARWALYRLPDRQLPCAQTLARAVGCPDAPSSVMVECLRATDPFVIINAPISGCASYFNGNWAPRVDNYFLLDVPENLFTSDDYQRLDLLTGTVPDEVSDEYPGVPGIEVGWSRQEKESRMYSWSRRWNELADVMNAAVKHEYDLPGNDYGQQRDLFLEMRGDFEYIAPHASHVTAHSRLYPNSYLYSFEYRSVNCPLPEWMGVAHFEEIYYIYGTPFWPPSNETRCPWVCQNVVWQSRQAWVAKDIEISRRMMAAWTNFARVGLPDDGATTWPRYNDNTQPYALINEDALGDTAYYKYRRVEFWNQLVPNILNVTAPCAHKKTVV